MTKIGTGLAAALLTAGIAGTAAAGQSSASNDYFGSWRWSEQESLLNLQRAVIQERKEDGGFSTDVHNDYSGANFGTQQSISIGNQTVQECEVSGNGYCESTQDSSGDQAAGNQNNSGGSTGASAASNSQPLTTD